MKRITQWLIAVVMAVACCLPAFAVQAEQPTGTATGTITVNNAPAGGTVTAYPMLVGKYNEYGLLGYTPVNAAVAEKINQVNKLSAPAAAGTVMSYDDVMASLNYDTASAISGIRGQITPSYPMAAGTPNTTFTAEVPAGAYVVVVENPGTSTRVYNVGMVSVNWTGKGDDATIAGGNVDLESEWKGTETLKSQEVTLDKSMSDLDKDDTENGAAFDKNEPIHFNVKTAIPNYNNSLYTTVTYKITDTFSTGLTLLVDNEHPFEVTVGTEKIEAGAGTYTLTPNADKSGYVLEFASAFILAHIGQPVALSYYGTISGDQYNFDGTTNTAELEYSNNPADSADTEKVSDKTYQYSFAIDGAVNGTNSTVNEELVKVNENFTAVVPGEPINNTERLEGAQFGIWEGTDTTKTPLQTVTSDSKGLMNFSGLDTGTYTIKEIKAPDGYTLNEEPITVVISATYLEDGRLKDYTITVNGENTNKYTADYTGTTTVITPDPGNTSFPVKNTKIPSLPSTGGTGTIAITAGGVVLMGMAAMYVMNKRRKEQN